MALRLLEIVLPEQDGAELRDILEAHELLEHRQIRLPDGDVLVRSLLDAEQLEPVLALLASRHTSREGNRLVLLPVEAILPPAEVEKKLASSPDGLSQAKAEKRLARYEPNEIAEKETSAFLKFLSYFWGPIPWMIEVAVILSAIDRHWPDFGIILVLLIANAVVGFREEHQAGDAIAALKARLAVKAPDQARRRLIRTPFRSAASRFPSAPPNWPSRSA